MIIRKSCLITLLLFGVFNINALAQTVFLSQPVNITVPTVLDLTTTAGGLNNVNFNTTALLDNGITLTNATTFTYSSNKAWYVTIKAASANFSGSSSTPMPASVIQYRLNGSGGSFTALSATAASLTGTTGTKNTRGTSTIGVDFFLNPGYVYAPATDYTITINYTISNL